MLARSFEPQALAPPIPDPPGGPTAAIDRLARPARSAREVRRLETGSYAY